MRVLVGVGRIAAMAAMLVGSAFAMAQQAEVQQPVQLENFYAAGVSYNGSGSPAVAGTALYAHQVSKDTAPGLYAFAMYDALPTQRKPLTLTNSVGAGVAQKVFTVAGVDVFAPTAAGIAYNGPNVGWAWNTGLIAPIRYKQTPYYITPVVRVSKSSVGGDGYTPIVGVLFGWGK